MTDQVTDAAFDSSVDPAEAVDARVNALLEIELGSPGLTDEKAERIAAMGLTLVGYYRALEWAISQPGKADEYPVIAAKVREIVQARRSALERIAAAR